MDRIRTADGFVEFRKGKDGTVEIYDIAVESVRGVGHGRDLIELLMGIAYPHTIFAFVREENENARGFYKHLGFVETEIIQDFYCEGNAVLVTKICE